MKPETSIRFYTSEPDAEISQKTNLHFPHASTGPFDLNPRINSPLRIPLVCNTAVII
jgi:hypothetical protein